jgi:protein-tyrosine phosphatase
MIDIHTHILPGMDDGAPDYDETTAMLTMAREDGITDIVATPHANLRYEFDPDRCRRELDRIALECQSGPSVYLGCELHLTPENLDAVLQRPDLFTLNGKGCLLLELPHSLNPVGVEASVQRLLNARIRPIIAHPEREHLFQRDPSYAAHLREMGVYFQVTAQAIIEEQDSCMGLLKHRLIHVVASDAHGVSHRRPQLSAAYEAIFRGFGKATAELLFVENPGACLAGLPLAAPQPRRSFFSFFSRRPASLQARLPTRSLKPAT